jgi:hypothetical protein
MAREKVQIRLDPTNMAYLDDLVKIGAYGKDTTAVARRFIADGILDALGKGLIEKRTVAEAPKRTRTRKRSPSAPSRARPL